MSQRPRSHRLHEPVRSRPVHRHHPRATGRTEADPPPTPAAGALETRAALPADSRSSRSRLGLFAIRYGVGGVLVVAGFVLLGLNPGGFGVDGFAMSTGSGLSVLLLNWLYRLGVSGDREREREEEARTYLARHGRWPD